VALRTGKKLWWDAGDLKATNAPEADAFIKETYRSGWEDRLRVRRTAFVPCSCSARTPGDLAGQGPGEPAAVLVDHAHLERKAATTALNLEKYRDLYGPGDELNAIAIEELQHFELVLGLLRGGEPVRPGASQSMDQRSDAQHPQRAAAPGHRPSDLRLADRGAELREVPMAGRGAPRLRDPELSAFYGGLVESEGNHYASYLIMARHIDLEETERRLDFYLISMPSWWCRSTTWRFFIE
jgi:tRNA-(ms[2]io[6]A)-hydroxylase